MAERAGSSTRISRRALSGQSGRRQAGRAGSPGPGDQRRDPGELECAANVKRSPGAIAFGVLPERAATGLHVP